MEHQQWKKPQQGRRLRRKEEVMALSITGTPTKIQVTGEKLDDVIENRQQAQAVAAAMDTAPKPVEPKDDGQA